MPPKRRVFLSHASEFAKHPKRRSYVDAAKQACEIVEAECEDMSDWPASGERPADECARRVRDCDVYVGIIGFSYGTQVRDRKQQTSFTELEYQEARRNGLHVLLFFLAGNGKMRLDLSRGDPKHSARQDEFRRQLKSAHMIDEFRNPVGLRKRIVKALKSLPADRPSAVPTSVAPPPFLVPPLPDPLVRRIDLTTVVQRIREAVDVDDIGTLHSTAGSRTVVIVGQPGYGKSVLADWVGHELKGEFPDGVLRVEIGAVASHQVVIERCRDLVGVYEDDCPTFPDTFAAGRYLGRVLRNRRALLIVDDVDRTSDLDPFLHGAPRTVVLVTTRDRRVAPDGATTVEVGPLPGAQTEQLLFRGVDATGVDWSDLTEQTAGSPLVANLANGVIRGRNRDRDVGEAVSELTDTLRESTQTGRERADPEGSEYTSAATARISVERLRDRHGEEAVTQFRNLAIFPVGVDIPLELLAAWWHLSMSDVGDFARTLQEWSLVENFDPARATIRPRHIPGIQDIPTQTTDLRRLHAEFLDSHHPRQGRWADLPEDATYLWRWTVWHLRQAGRFEEVVATVRDARYLAKKTHILSTTAVLDDLRFAADSDAGKRYRQFRLWSDRLDGLPRAADIAASILARTMDSFIDDPSPRLPGPAIRFDSRWKNPESDQTALVDVLGSLEGRVQSCAWSADGRRLVAVDGGGIAHVWEIDGRREPRRFPGDGWISAAAWSPDGDRVACADDGGVVQLWTIEGDGPPDVIGRHQSGVRAIAWSPDGRRLATGGDDGVRIWLADDGQDDPPLTRKGWVRDLAWSPTGSLLAGAFDDGEVAVWRPDDPERSIRRLGRHAGGAYSVCWSDDGNFLMSGGQDGKVRRRPVHERNSPVALAKVGSVVRSLARSADGREVAYATEDGQLHRWAVDGVVGPAAIGRHEGQVLTAAWQPGGRLLASGGHDRELRLWRVDGAARGERSPDGGLDPVLSLAWSPSGDRLVGGTLGGALLSWNTSGGGEPVRLDRRACAIRAVAWSSDGRLLAHGGDDATILVASTEDPSETLRLRAPSGWVRALSWSPQSCGLASLGGDGSVRIWSVEDGTAQVVLHRSAGIRSIAWSPDGSRLATGSHDGGVQVWDAAPDGSRIPVELGHLSGQGVRAVAWCPDGRSLVTGHNDGAVRLWQLDRAGNAFCGRHLDEVIGLTWGLGGSRIISIGADGVVRVWPDDGNEGCALALRGRLNEVAADPTSERFAVAGSYGLYVLQVER